MPRRIILHAGFHNTGASGIQATLRENRVALKKHIALRLRWHMQDLVHSTGAYSVSHDPLILEQAQGQFDTLMNELPGMPRRTLIISAEQLAGHLPGRGDLSDYAAAPVLLYAFWEGMTKRYPAAEIKLYLSTCAPELWLASTYADHVRSSNMTQEFDAFRTRYHKVAALDDMVADIASRVPCPVHHTALEDCKDLPLGPADPLLDLCDIPLSLRAELTAPPTTETPLNDDVLRAMIEVNRSQTDPAARKAAKAALLAEAQKQ